MNYFLPLALLVLQSLGDFPEMSRPVAACEINEQEGKKITSTETLTAAIIGRYKGKWATAVTFVQYNTHYQNDSIKGKSTWYEAIEYPGNFRIDFEDPKNGNAVIFARDSVFSFKAGALIGKKPRINNLMLLAGGLPFFSKEEGMKRLREAGYNTAVFHEDTWQGKPVYVVGAEKGDLKTNQFWIDKKRLYLVRTIETVPAGNSGESHVREARFSKHIKVAGGWIETEVLFLTDGKKEQLENYTQINVNPKLDKGIFDAAQFGKVHWKND